MIAAFLLGGCALLPLESPGVPHSSGRVKPAILHGLKEAVGVIHIHSTYSDGLGSIEGIAKIANLQGLDYLILTDHDTLQPKRDGKQGRHGKTLVLTDEEISTQGGHYVALRLKQEVPRLQPPQETVEAVAKAGGLGFIAHPFWPRRPWKDPETRGMTGLEIYNAVEDITEENLIALGLGTVLGGSDLTILQWLDRSEKSLELWDRMLSRGDRVVGIGSTDAHGLRRWGLRLGPYTTMFKLVRDHLLLKDLSEASIYDALEKGHLFIAHDRVADAKGFTFLALDGQSPAGIMGDSVKWKPGLKLYAYLPSPGSITLFKDGHAGAAVSGQEGWFVVPAPGVYRIEATRKAKPWIYSNPIYVIE